MDYCDAEQGLEDFVDQDEFDELRESLTDSGGLNPCLQYLGDRAVFYLQVEDGLSSDEYSRVALAEYRNGEEHPVPFSEDQLEEILDGTGEVSINESLVNDRDINYPKQREMKP